MVGAAFSESIESKKGKSPTRLPALLDLLTGKAAGEVETLPLRFLKCFFSLLWILFLFLFGLEAQPPMTFCTNPPIIVVSGPVIDQ